MTHGSLFSGIGGFDLAADWMGWQNIFHCEWNPFGQQVLKYYWPKAISYADITKTDFTVHRGAIDILTGGFPCQPYSQAGKRKGKEDERHLWPEMLRAIREIQPRWVVGENVRGLINWNGGLVFDEVQADLEAAGYEVFPFLLPAAGVNAPHERYRIWFVAYRADSGLEGVRRKWKDSVHGFRAIADSKRNRDVYNSGRRGHLFDEKRNYQKEECQWHNISNGSHGNSTGDVANPLNTGLQGTKRCNRSCKKRQPIGQCTKFASQSWAYFPTQSPVCNGDDGISAGLDGITFSKWRNESIKAGGNAIVPQVVYQIFKAIEAYEHAL